MGRMFLSLLVALLLSVALSGRAVAEPPQNNIVEFQTEVSREVDNRIMTVVLAAVAEAAAAPDAASRVNTMMASALSRVKQLPSITHRTLTYRTAPRYRKQDVVGWEVSQELLLESEDVESLSAVVGELQNDLQLRRMHFAVSPEQIREVAAQMTADVLEAFTERAKMITKALGAQDYVLVRLSLNEGSTLPLRMNEGMAMMDAQGAPPVAVEPGESTLTVSASGSVQLIF